MTDWQQALDRRLVQRLQPPLAKKNIGQRLVDRTDRFLTRFSLVEQQFQRWGNFQATNPNPVPVVFAKPSTAATPSNTPIQSAAIATSSPSFPSVSTPNNPASDVLVQRKIDSTISPVTENVTESKPSSPLAETPPDVVFVENFEANPIVSSELPLLDNTAAIDGSETTNISVDMSLPPVDSLSQPESVTKETASPDIQLVAPAENLTAIDPASEELVLGRSPNNFPPNVEQPQNAAITSQLITAQFSDVPLVLAQPITPSLPSEPQRQAPESLPVVRTRLEQLLNQKKSRSKLPTVQPQKITPKLAQPVVTPLTNSVDPSVETSATPVQPLPTAQNSAQAPTLSFGNAANATQQGRSPTSPLSSFPKPPSPTTQTNAQIPNPNIQAAKNPIVETFRAPAMDNSAPPKVDIQAIADQVEKKIRRRIVVESERRGQGKWR